VEKAEAEALAKKRAAEVPAAALEKQASEEPDSERDPAPKKKTGAVKVGKKKQRVQVEDDF
jgi:hypothetical protein